MPTAYPENINIAVVIINRESYTSGHFIWNLPGPLAQWGTCLTADLGVTISIPARSHTFVEIDGIISTVILLPSA